ncbi:MAG TPA: hypothetical protein VMB47_18270 [Candidatus Aquilonibacter sp.]|nr:hypothetical protein [Candidatus Aquilonibacter sp.]
MNSKKPPVAIIFLGLLYIAVGAVNFAHHFRQSLASPRGGVWVLLVELLAIVAGAFLLRGQNWARWLALAWMLFHVAISAAVLRELIIHGVICILIAWLLFRPESTRYFRPPPLEQT